MSVFSVYNKTNEQCLSIVATDGGCAWASVALSSNGHRSLSCPIESSHSSPAMSRNSSLCSRCSNPSHRSSGGDGHFGDGNIATVAAGTHATNDTDTSSSHGSEEAFPAPSDHPRREEEWNGTRGNTASRPHRGGATGMQDTELSTCHAACSAVTLNKPETKTDAIMSVVNDSSCVSNGNLIDSNCGVRKRNGVCDSNDVHRCRRGDGSRHCRAASQMGHDRRDKTCDARSLRLCGSGIRRLCRSRSNQSASRTGTPSHDTRDSSRGDVIDDDSGTTEVDSAGSVYHPPHARTMLSSRRCLPHLLPHDVFLEVCAYLSESEYRVLLGVSRALHRAVTAADAPLWRPLCGRVWVYRQGLQDCVMRVMVREMTHMKQAWKDTMAQQDAIGRQLRRLQQQPQQVPPPSRRATAKKQDEGKETCVGVRSADCTWLPPDWWSAAGSDDGDESDMGGVRVGGQWGTRASPRKHHRRPYTPRKAVLLCRKRCTPGDRRVTARGKLAYVTKRGSGYDDMGGEGRNVNDTELLCSHGEHADGLACVERMRFDRADGRCCIHRKESAEDETVEKAEDDNGVVQANPDGDVRGGSECNAGVDVVMTSAALSVAGVGAQLSSLLTVVQVDAETPTPPLPCELSPTGRGSREGAGGSRRTKMGKTSYTSSHTDHTTSYNDTNNTATGFDPDRAGVLSHTQRRIGFDLEELGRPTYHPNQRHTRQRYRQPRRRRRHTTHACSHGKPQHHHHNRKRTHRRKQHHSRHRHHHNRHRSCSGHHHLQRNRSRQTALRSVSAHRAQDRHTVLHVSSSRHASNDKDNTNTTQIRYRRHRRNPSCRNRRSSRRSRGAVTDEGPSRSARRRLRRRRGTANGSLSPYPHTGYTRDSEDEKGSRAHTQQKDRLNNDNWSNSDTNNHTKHDVLGITATYAAIQTTAAVARACAQLPPMLLSMPKRGSEVTTMCTRASTGTASRSKPTTTSDSPTPQPHSSERMVGTWAAPASSFSGVVCSSATDQAQSNTRTTASQRQTGREVTNGSRVNGAYSTLSLSGQDSCHDTNMSPATHAATYTPGSTEGLTINTASNISTHAGVNVHQDYANTSDSTNWRDDTAAPRIAATAAFLSSSIDAALPSSRASACRQAGSDCSIARAHQATESHALLLTNASSGSGHVGSVLNSSCGLYWWQLSPQTRLHHLQHMQQQQHRQKHDLLHSHEVKQAVQQLRCHCNPHPHHSREDDRENCRRGRDDYPLHQHIQSVVDVPSNTHSTDTRNSSCCCSDATIRSNTHAYCSRVHTERTASATATPSVSSLSSISSLSTPAEGCMQRHGRKRSGSVPRPRRMLSSKCKSRTGAAARRCRQYVTLAQALLNVWRSPKKKLTRWRVQTRHTRARAIDKEALLTQVFTEEEDERDSDNDTANLLMHSKSAESDVSWKFAYYMSIRESRRMLLTVQDFLDGVWVVCFRAAGCVYPISFFPDQTLVIGTTSLPQSQQHPCNNCNINAHNAARCDTATQYPVLRFHLLQGGAQLVVDNFPPLRVTRRSVQDRPKTAQQHKQQTKPHNEQASACFSSQRTMSADALFQAEPQRTLLCFHAAMNAARQQIALTCQSCNEPARCDAHSRNGSGKSKVLCAACVLQSMLNVPAMQSQIGDAHCGSYGRIGEAEKDKSGNCCSNDSVRREESRSQDESAMWLRKCGHNLRGCARAVFDPDADGGWTLYNSHVKIFSLDVHAPLYADILH